MIDDLNDAALGRRTLLRSMGGLALGAGAIGLLAGCSGDGDDSIDLNPPNPPDPTIADSDVLNFALNLEYLEAEYYLRALTGEGLTGADAGPGAGDVTGGRKVTFSSDLIGDLAFKLAEDERDHVRVLRSVLAGKAVARPAINFTAAFNAAAQAAGLGSTFDPFENETNFLLGAFVFEDVGVTAYLGGATLLTSKSNLVSAAKILGVEAYHAGAVRALINKAGSTAINAAAALSDLRDDADGSADKDQPATLDGRANYVPTDDNALAFVRTTGEVIKIVTLGSSNNRGGFFPQGLNGKVK